eukprot:SAG25_NODE_197_length_12126_cov_39.030515_13_plen_117_part_00
MYTCSTTNCDGIDLPLIRGLWRVLYEYEYSRTRKKFSIVRLPYGTVVQLYEYEYHGTSTAALGIPSTSTRGTIPSRIRTKWSPTRTRYLGYRVLASNYAYMYNKGVELCHMQAATI